MVIVLQPVRFSPFTKGNDAEAPTQEAGPPIR